MILVVGGAGYIGSHVVRALREEGEPHVVFDSFELGHEQAILGSPFVRGDMRNEEDLGCLFARYPNIDLVIHFAAYTSAGESLRLPDKYFRNNTVGSLNLLEAARSAGVSRVIYSSTSTLFGEPRYLPVDEDHPKVPLNAYGRSKLMVEDVLDAFDDAHAMKSVCFRYFNASGADASGEIGEDHTPETHIIPLAIQAAMGTREPLSLFGTDYGTKDGTCVRDYIHVSDIAAAHLLAIKHLRQGCESQKFNVGTGLGFSVRETFDAIEQVSGLKVPIIEKPRRACDAAEQYGSSAKLQSEWGWTPKYQTIEEIVETAWRWHEGHPHGYQ